MPTKKELEEKLAALEAANAQKDQELENAQMALAEMEDTSELEARIAELEGSLSTKESALQAAQTALATPSEKEEELTKQVEELNEALATRPSASLLAEKDAEIKRLRAEMGANNYVHQPVQGQFKSIVHKPTGEKLERTYEFMDGQLAVRVLPSVTDAVNITTRVSTEGLMQLANTGKVKEEYIEYSPVLKNFSQEQAQEVLDWLANIKYGLLKMIDEQPVKS